MDKRMGQMEEDKEEEKKTAEEIRQEKARQEEIARCERMYEFTDAHVPYTSLHRFYDMEFENREAPDDMLGDMPNWLIHTGSYIVYGLIVLLVAGSALIKYPDIVPSGIFIDDIDLFARIGYQKTKYLLDMANTAIKESKGSIVYLDKSSKHMYELSNKIRLINVAEFPVHSPEGFVGFLCGIISQDHDLETMYLDSFLKLSSLEGEDISTTLSELDQISAKYHVNFVLSVSLDGEELPASAKDMVLVAL